MRHPADLARAAAGSLARALREQQRLGAGLVDAETLARAEAAMDSFEDALTDVDSVRTASQPVGRGDAHGPSSGRSSWAAGDAKTQSHDLASAARAASGRPAPAEVAVGAVEAAAPSVSSSEDTSPATAAPAVDATPMLDLPWVPQTASSATVSTRAEPMQILSGVERPTLEAIREVLGPCERCGLCENRSNIVFGVGDSDARLMFIGEAPGRDEDQRGEPFVGRAGELLTRMIGAMGLAREDVYIANIVKCRPPDNRDPTPAEIAACEPFVQRQIDSVRPDVIVTLGRVALQAMTKQKLSIMRTRGQWLEVRGVPTMPTLHPAFLLRKPEFKREAWSDLQLVMQRLGLSGGR
jgi:DNA polymerase